MATPQELGDLQLFLIRQRGRAIEGGFALEAFEISMFQLELGLRQLLSTRSGRQNRPLDTATVDGCSSLTELTALGLKEGFIDEAISGQVANLLTRALKVKGDLSSCRQGYTETERSLLVLMEVAGDIQRRWLKIPGLGGV